MANKNCNLSTSFYFQYICIASAYKRKIPRLYEFLFMFNYQCIKTLLHIHIYLCERYVCVCAATIISFSM